MWVGFAITAVALILFSVLSAEVYYQASVSHSEEYLRGYVSAFEGEDPASFTPQYASDASERLGGARVTFLTPEGEIISDSLEGEMGMRTDRPEVVSAMEHGEGFHVRSSATAGDEMAYFCKSFDGYMVRVSILTSSLWEIYVQSLPMVLVFLVVDAGLCLLITYLSTGFMLRPMDQIVKDAATKKQVATKCSELRPIAELINRLNEEAEEKMREVDEEKELVLKAQKSKNEFISNITHEMNTPLTSIKGFAELLSTGGMQGESAQRAAKIILSQSERLTSLVACIINYNEIDGDELPAYEVNATKIARETLELLEPSVKERNLTVTAQIEDDVVLMSRYERITQIFGNLIRNAIRYNRDGGSIAVVLTKEEFSVTDTGIGIAEENIDRIFERFFTVDKSHGGQNGGFGLGLAVVRKLCRKAGWELSVQSKLGEGTAFHIRFAK